MPPFIRLWRNYLIRRQNHPLHAGNCVSVEYKRVIVRNLVHGWERLSAQRTASFLFRSETPLRLGRIIEAIIVCLDWLQQA